MDERASKEYGLHYVFGESGVGLGQNKLITGNNSGYQAINLAYLLGAKNIYLLGFDMKGGHWHGEHPPELNRANPYWSWIKNFDKLAFDLQENGVDVVNCTRDTALKCFKQRKLEEV